MNDRKYTYDKFRQECRFYVLQMANDTNFNVTLISSVASEDSDDELSMADLMPAELHEYLRLETFVKVH